MSNPTAHRRSALMLLIYILLMAIGVPIALADDIDHSISLWPEFAPGETTREPGTPRSAKEVASPPITRIEKITQPTLDIFPAENPNGTAVVVLPGGGYGYVVTDLEGSEVAPFLNEQGVSVFVLRYRTGDNKSPDVWKRPVQDAQRAVRWLRANATKWSLDPEKIGVLGFSAGGQAAAFTLTAKVPMYEAGDDVDQHAWQPSFGILVYPWRLLDDAGKLKSGIHVDDNTPKTIIIHTHDDPSADSLGSIELYRDLKNHQVDSELHVYRTGGHGYGLRKRADSTIHKWPALVSDWLRLHKLGR